MATATTGQVVQDYNTLTPEEKREVARQLNLPIPNDPAALGRIWLLLLGGLITVAILAGVGAFVLAAAENDVSGTFLAIVTAIVGGLLGLFAPSPATK